MKDVFIFLVLIFGYVLGLSAARPLDYEQYLVTFTDAGCSWANTSGIKLKKGEKSCTGFLRFNPRSFGEGGYVLLDDDRSLLMTGASILTLEALPQDLLPDTPGQIRAKTRVTIIALVTLLTLLVLLVIFREKHTAKKHSVINGNTPHK